MKTYSERLAIDSRPSHEQITARAELLWNREGFPNGRDEQIWLEAERQLAEEAAEMALLTAGSQNRRANAAGQERPTDQMNPKASGGDSSKRRSGSRG